MQLLYSEALVSHEELEAFWGDGRMPPAPLGALSRGGGGGGVIPEVGKEGNVDS